MTKVFGFIFSISRCYYALRANHYLPIIINDYEWAGITVAATMRTSDSRPVATTLRSRPGNGHRIRRIWRKEMNFKLGRSAISALCAGIVFCFATISTPAQDYHQTYMQPYSQPYPQSYSQPYSGPGLSSRAASNGDDMDNALKGSADATKIFLD